MFDWRKGLWSVCHGYSLHSAIYLKLISVHSGCCIDLWPIRGGGGVILPWVYVHSSIGETYLV